MSDLHRCTLCGHVHDPEDGRCDAHAKVGLGCCPCLGDDETIRRARNPLPPRPLPMTLDRKNP